MYYVHLDTLEQGAGDEIHQTALKSQYILIPENFATDPQGKIFVVRPREWNNIGKKIVHFLSNFCAFWVNFTFTK